MESDGLAAKNKALIFVDPAGSKIDETS